jgi:hypothetical protein
VAPEETEATAPRRHPEEVESLEEKASPGAEESESPGEPTPEACRRRPEEMESPAKTEVDQTWCCVVQVPNVKLSALRGATTDIGMGKRRLASEVQQVQSHV